MMGSTAAAEEVERDFHETFEVREGMRLHLEHGDGDVSLKTWDQTSWTSLCGTTLT